MNPEHIVIEITADTQGLQKTIDLLEKLGKIDAKTAAEFRAATKVFEERNKSVQDAGKKVEDFGRKSEVAGQKIKGSFKDVGSNLGSVDKAISNIGSAIVGAFAIQQVIAFGEACVHAFQEAEKNALLLKSAVDVNGGLQSDFEELIRQSEELQKVTIFSDDDIQRAQTAALQYGLTKDQVQALIPVITDFAAATGQNLQQALDGVLQGINGVGRGLKIYGVTIDENGTRSSRLAAITEQLTKKFEGQAEAVGKTAFGAAEKYKNELDDLQEKIGGRLSPILQSLRGLFLDLASAGVSAAEGVKNFFGASEDAANSVDRILEKNKIQVDNFKKQFESLSDIELDNKLDNVIARFNESIETAKKEAGVQKALARQAAVEFANQATAIREIIAARKHGIDTLNEEEEALKRIKNISALPTKELESLLKTLNKFNDIDARDAIDKINKEIEARKKAGEKEVSTRQAALQKLNELETKASDDLVNVKAEEVSKVVALEAKKQQAIRDLVDSAGKASGANVEPILIEFQEKGRVNVEKTLQLLKDAKFPTAEIDKFTDAVNNTIAAFDTLQRKEINVSNIVSIKTQFTETFDFIEKQAEQTSKDIDEKFTNKKLELVANFKLTGATPEQFKQIENQFEQLDKQRIKETLKVTIESKETELKLAQEKNEQLTRIGSTEIIDTKKIQEQITVLKKQQNDIQVQDFLDSIQEQIDIEERLAQQRKEIFDSIVPSVQQFLGSVQTLYNNHYDKLAQGIQDNLDRTIAAYDKELDANEDLHEKKKIGDRKYEENKKKLLEARTAAEEKASKEQRRIAREQAIKNKEIAVVNATLSGIQGVARAFADYPYPADLIVAGIVGALAAAEVAAALSTPVPALAKGTEMVTGKGTETSDEVPARLSVGERVVTAKTNRRFFPILSAIHREKFDPESLNSISKFSREELRMLTKTDRSLIKQLATMQPVFIKHTEIPQHVELRRDLASQATQKFEFKHIITKDHNSLDEYDIQRGVSRARMQISDESLKRLAKYIKEEQDDPYWRYKK